MGQKAFALTMGDGEVMGVGRRERLVFLIILMGDWNKYSHICASVPTHARGSTFELGVLEDLPDRAGNFDIPGSSPRSTLYKYSPRSFNFLATDIVLKRVPDLYVIVCFLQLLSGLCDQHIPNSSFQVFHFGFRAAIAREPARFIAWPLDLPVRLKTFPSSISMDVAQKFSPERIEAQDSRVADNDEKCLCACQGNVESAWVREEAECVAEVMRDLTGV